MGGRRVNLRTSQNAIHTWFQASIVSRNTADRYRRKLIVERPRYTASHSDQSC